MILIQEEHGARCVACSRNQAEITDISIHIISASEKTPNASLTKAQTALGKQKNTFCIERGYLSYYRNSVKRRKRFLTQNVTKIRQSAADLLPKDDVLNFHIWSRDFHRVRNLYLYTASKSDDFSLRCGDLTIFKMADLHHLKFYGSNNRFPEKPTRRQ